MKMSSESTAINGRGLMVKNASLNTSGFAVAMMEVLFFARRPEGLK